MVCLPPDQRFGPLLFHQSSYFVSTQQTLTQRNVVFIGLVLNLKTDSRFPVSVDTSWGVSFFEKDPLSTTTEKSISRVRSPRWENPSSQLLLSREFPPLNLGHVCLMSQGRWPILETWLVRLHDRHLGSSLWDCFFLIFVSMTLLGLPLVPLLYLHPLPSLLGSL